MLDLFLILQKVVRLPLEELTAFAAFLGATALLAMSMSSMSCQSVFQLACQNLLYPNESRNASIPDCSFGQPNINLGIDGISAFSGAGPLRDGRIKPDIVAPGGAPGILSAASSNYPISGIGADTTSK